MVHHAILEVTVFLMVNRLSGAQSYDKVTRCSRCGARRRHGRLLLRQVDVPAGDAIAIDFARGRGDALRRLRHEHGRIQSDRQ